ncbi:NUDIX hydrolase domain-like, partial [Trinorchestia longiramus]
VLVKEAEEEASIPAHIVQNAKAAGTVSFFTESERGIHANTEYVFDLELPKDFQPSINDGEAQGFAFIKTEDIMPYLLSPNFKLTSTPVLVSFLIRHGIINSDTVSDLPQIVEMLHTPLSFYYCKWPSFPSLFSPTRESSPDNTSVKFVRESVSTSPSPYCSSSAIPIVSSDHRQEHILGSAIKNPCSSMTDDDCASMKSEDRDSEED